MDEIVGFPLFMSYIYHQKPGKYMIITSNLYKSQMIYNSLKSFLSEEEILLLPNDELIRAGTLSSFKEMMANRIFALDRVGEMKNGIIIANLSAVNRFYPSPNLFKDSTLNLKVGDTINILELRKKLIKMNYSKVIKVDQSFQFASRGDIIDIFSVNYDKPIRIEFFGDEIESIRTFDIATQQSIEKVDSIKILPGSDMLLTDNEIINAWDKIQERAVNDKGHLSNQNYEFLLSSIEDVHEELIDGILTNKNYKYFAYIQDKRYSLFDYLKDFKFVVVDEIGLKQSNKLLNEESFTYLEELHEAGKCISHLGMFYNFEDIFNLYRPDLISVNSLPITVKDQQINIIKVPYSASKVEDAFNIIDAYLNEEYKIILCLTASEHIFTLEDAFKKKNQSYEVVHDFELPKGKIGISALNIPYGFLVPSAKVIYLTSKELFNEKTKSNKVDSHFKEATILKSFEELKPGDYVVHEYEGIGQFVELQTIDDKGTPKDYLKLAYANDEYLYVPLTQCHMVRKYMGREGSKVRLSRLHSKDWEKTKERIKNKVNDLANRLMNLYVERSKVQGFMFQKDDEFQEAFEKSFEHELTHDQSKAIDEIKRDMESSSPMDRLLCGDVGFGKTEVAFRAAFKAINSGKQVALLCPTTLLARQHYELAKERFSPFDVKIAIFSRLIPEKIQKKYIEEIKEGKIHLIIGTHRLLNKEIVYNDLGLLIIDEEQRFGVEQKERLKELKTNIDVLTLSATPIPRTLQISLLGVRSLSLINTAPFERMPIQTYVSPFDPNVVKELIERELGRNGQIFYMHNNIDTLYFCVQRLEKLLPGVSIGVAHGQMDRNQIEDVMLKFYNGEISVLVCTSIIENGIDVPNANMIIVEDSERYGLAQLYQIKGRVGRSDRLSYAYLMYTPNKVLNEKARSRLQAIQDFTDLGSGYKIAQRDLMIRGAGDILGPEQAGFIDSIGLDMYIRLLNEAIKEKVEGKKQEDINELTFQTTLGGTGFVPKDFANDSEKIELYQSILACEKIKDLNFCYHKVEDIFGKIPSSVDKLFKQRRIYILSKDAKIESLDEKAKFVEIILSKTYIGIHGIGNILFEAMIPYLKNIKVSYSNNVFKIILSKQENWLDDLQNILEALVNVLITNRLIEGTRQ